MNENSVEESDTRFSRDTVPMPGSQEANRTALDGTQVSSMIRKNQHDKSKEDKHATLIFASPYDDDDGEVEDPGRRLEAVDEMESSEGGVSEERDGQNASFIPEVKQKEKHDQMQHLQKIAQQQNAGISDEEMRQIMAVQRKFDKQAR